MSQRDGGGGGLKATKGYTDEKKFNRGRVDHIY
jgi:hypothetical protein